MKRKPIPRSLRKNGQKGPVAVDGLPLHRKVGEALKRSRRAAGMSLAELQRLRGLDYHSLNWTEKTRSGCFLATLVDRCEVIGIRPSDVVALAEQL